MESLKVSQAGDQKYRDWADMVQGSDADVAELTEEMTKVGRDELACIIYTSGTGGAPRGVMLHHGSIICNVDGAAQVLREDFGLDNERFLSFLPLSHAYEHSGGQFLPIGVGAEIYYAEGLEKLVEEGVVGKGAAAFLHDAAGVDVDHGRGGGLDHRGGTARRPRGAGVVVRAHARLVGESRDILGTSLRAIAAEGAGALLYMQPANREEALLQKIAPAPDRSSPPPGMDLRDYGIGAQILRTLGLTRIRLLTQHPRKIVGLDGYGVEIVEQIEIPRTPPTPGPAATA
jgi:hypothetical protein